jgi:hypothetical protein
MVLANSLSATRWISAIVASDNSRESTYFSGAVSPSGCGCCSDLETTDCSLVEESWSRGRGHEGGEGQEERVLEQHCVIALVIDEK